ncbi:MAG: cytochrome c3 family protein [Verrucomicrobiales bacterium]|nr:cytochrome c3 family protein [Verrucomicrobiales bacterium]
MANFFPRWTNTLPLQIIAALLVLSGGVSLGVWYYFTPKYTRVGYQPNQPVPFSHKIHVTQLGMDCRYCHSFVEQSEHANVPTSATCWNCHMHVKPNSPNLAKLKESVETGKPMEWIKVHKVPDYAYFNHSVHVSSGISCVSCHGDVGEMPVVFHDQPQSMSWCLDCHRNPENSLRPLDKITDLKWKPENDGKTQAEMGEKLKKNWHIEAPENCAACHR